MSNNLKFNLVQQITAPIIFSRSDISDETKLRVVIENAAGGNTVVVRARITGQSDWDVLSTITGSNKSVVSVTTYDEIQVECTVYASSSNHVMVIASSFNEAGGSTSIDAPSGGTITGEEITFTSSDGTLDIIADPDTNTIDFKVLGAGSSAKYVKTLILSDWIGPSAGEYTLSIPFSFHGKSNPVVTCLETNGSDFDVVETTVMLTGNDVQLRVLSSPDTRFVGKIFID